MTELTILVLLALVLAAGFVGMAWANAGAQRASVLSNPAAAGLIFSFPRRYPGEARIFSLAFERMVGGGRRSRSPCAGGRPDPMFEQVARRPGFISEGVSPLSTR